MTAGLSRDDTIALGTPGAADVWAAFYDLSQIPRMSKREAAVLDYIKRVADKHSLTHKCDAFGNVAAFRPGSGKGANSAPVIVQAHVDMVCEKNDDVQHDFLADPVRFRRDGEWLKALGTTLGADNGLGAAAAIVLMQQPDSADLPPLEMLFTTEEEIGLNGAKALDAAALGLTAKRLVNMDSEEWGEICIGCAGGGHSTITLPAPTEAAPAGHSLVRLAVGGLMGGHSGLMIHEGRGNAVKCLARLCHMATRAAPGVRLAELQGGDKHNAIPREGRAALLVPDESRDAVQAALISEVLGLREAYSALETDMHITIYPASRASQDCLTSDAAGKLLALAELLPHGVDKMSHVMDNLVETSCNLASVKHMDGQYQMVVSSRSSVATSLHALRARIQLLAEQCGATVAQNEIYPGWNPAPQSDLVTRVKQIYTEQFNLEPHLTAIHAGLECGILNARLGGGMDMVSYGPTIRGAHSPDERVEVATVSSFWDLTLALMRNLAEVP